jgi:hypothetical protein
VNYNEHYVIKYRTKDGIEGEFGPFLCEEDAMQQMKKIQNRHDHVRHITWAHLHRKMDVTIASWAGK